MKYWFFAVVVLFTNSSLAYNFTPNTKCVLCSTVIRCGPGVDAVIRDPQSGKEMRVGAYCAQIANEKDPKYRELRNIFNKNRFTYREYLDALPVLEERRISVTPKPLIGAGDLVNTGRVSDLQNYTNYILNSVDPTKDSDLEVDSDGKLVNKLDKQPQKVKDDLKSRMPSSENASVKRNGSWVSPEQDPYINPLNTDSSKAKVKKVFVTPSPTPTEWRSVMDDSFRRNYCRGKTDRECNDLWNLQNRKEEQTQEEKPTPEKVKNTKTTLPSTTVSSLPSMNPTIYSPPSGYGNESGGGLRLPASTGISNNDSQVRAVSSAATTANTTASSTTSQSYGVLRQDSTLNTKPFEKSVLSDIAMINTSPAYRSLDITTPYGTMVNVKVQSSGNIFSPGRPICESLEQWRTTSFFIDATRSANPTHPDITDGPINKALLGPKNYCEGTSVFDKSNCKFGTPQSACSCNDYSTQYLLEQCGKMFELKVEAPSLMITNCRNNLKKVIGEDQSIASKFARPYALSLGETYLCLDIPENNRKACSDQVTKKISNMSDKECKALHTALGPNAEKYINDPKNLKDLASYPWYKLYKYHFGEFKGMFSQVDLGVEPKKLRWGLSCKQQIRGVLEDLVAQLKKDNLREAQRSTASDIQSQRELKRKFTDICSEVKCKELFSRDIVKNFASETPSKDISVNLANETAKLTALYRDLSVYNNLNGPFCEAQSKNSDVPTQSPANNVHPLFPQEKFLQSPMPGAQ